jgi:hypothetical protein
MTWLPLSSTALQVELRVFHALFCEQYNIHQHALKFDDYLEAVMEKYLSEVLNIHPLCWVTLCVVALLNWSRVALSWSFFICHDADLHCLTASSVRMYTLAGE